MHQCSSRQKKLKLWQFYICFTVKRCEKFYSVPLRQKVKEHCLPLLYASSAGRLGKKSARHIEKREKFQVLNLFSQARIAPKTRRPSAEEDHCGECGWSNEPGPWDGEDRIVGGWPAERNVYPWQVRPL